MSTRAGEWKYEVEGFFVYCLFCVLISYINKGQVKCFVLVSKIVNCKKTIVASFILFDIEEFLIFPLLFSNVNLVPERTENVTNKCKK